MQFGLDAEISGRASLGGRNGKRDSVKFAADDWGFSPGINRAMVELARRGLLHSASCVANSPYLESHLAELNEFVPPVELALHFNLTDGKPLAAGVDSLTDPATGRFWPHRRLMLRALLGQIRGDEVAEELRAQYTELRRRGIVPTSLNGHHHIHLFPGIAGPVQKTMVELGLKKMRVMRDPSHRPSFTQTKFFELFARGREPIELEACFYLLPADLATEAAFRKKADLGVPLLVHPAAEDDFGDMSDPLRLERVAEFKAILKYLA